MGGANQTLQTWDLGKAMLASLDFLPGFYQLSTQCVRDRRLNPRATRQVARRYSHSACAPGNGLWPRYQSRIKIRPRHSKAKFPEHIVVYRDGTSKSQYDIVNEKELPFSKKACQNIYSASDMKKGTPPWLSSLLASATTPASTQHLMVTPSVPPTLNMSFFAHYFRKAFDQEGDARRCSIKTFVFDVTGEALQLIQEQLTKNLQVELDALLTSALCLGDGLQRGPCWNTATSRASATSESWRPRQYPGSPTKAQSPCVALFSHILCYGDEASLYAGSALWTENLWHTIIGTQQRIKCISLLEEMSNIIEHSDRRVVP